MTTEPRSTALVTGASGGIGWALAELLAADGHDLVLVARQRQKLEQLSGLLRQRHATSSLVVEVDLARPDAARAIVDRLAADGLTIDILVNNAGFGVLGPFAERDLDRFLAMIQVNVVALTALTRLLLPGMIARRRGRILNVSSTAAFQPGPLMAVYYATKAYVQSFSEAIANELEGTGVTVTALAPGPTPTGFQAAAGMDSSLASRGPMVLETMAVARAGYAAMMQGRRVVVAGLANRIAAQAYRFLPRRTLTAFVRRFQEGRESA